MRRFLCLGIFLLTFVFGVACSIYRDSYDRAQAAALHAREDVLKEDLRAMRRAIKQYSSEKGLPPQSLDDLVNAGYIRRIPPDPITDQRDWRVITGSYESKSGTSTGIVDVRSAAPGKASDGSLYSQW